MPKGVSLPKWPYGPEDPRWPACKCGCGSPVAAWYRGDAKRGILNGQPRDYAPKHHGRGCPDGVRFRGGDKWCTGCREYLPLSEFGSKANGERSGTAAICKACKRLDNDSRERKPPRFPERAAQLNRQRAHRRRARERGLPSEIYDEREIYDRDHGCCGICGRSVPWPEKHIDHVIPVMRGGPTMRWNLRVACHDCNGRKHDYLDEELGVVDLSNAHLEPRPAEYVGFRGSGFSHRDPRSRVSLT